jgi:hypothetical protein
MPVSAAVWSEKGPMPTRWCLKLRSSPNANVSGSVIRERSNADEMVFEVAIVSECQCQRQCGQRKVQCRRDGCSSRSSRQRVKPIGVLDVVLRSATGVMICPQHCPETPRGCGSVSPNAGTPMTWSYVPTLPASSARSPREPQQEYFFQIHPQMGISRQRTGASSG